MDETTFSGREDEPWKTRPVNLLSMIIHEEEGEREQERKRGEREGDEYRRGYLKIPSVEERFSP